MKKFAAHGPMIETGDDFTAGYYRIMEVDRKIASMNETIETLRGEITHLENLIEIMKSQR